MKYLLIAIALTLTACGTIQEQTLEYCDTETNTFIGIPVKREAQCVGVSNSDSGAAIEMPINSGQLPAR